jgi:hypothetical protein
LAFSTWRFVKAELAGILTPVALDLTCQIIVDKVLAISRVYHKTVRVKSQISGAARLAAMGIKV